MVTRIIEVTVSIAILLMLIRSTLKVNIPIGAIITFTTLTAVITFLEEKSKLDNK